MIYLVPVGQMDSAMTKRAREWAVRVAYDAAFRLYGGADVTVRPLMFPIQIRAAKGSTWRCTNQEPMNADRPSVCLDAEIPERTAVSIFAVGLPGREDDVDWLRFDVGECTVAMVSLGELRCYPVTFLRDAALDDSPQPRLGCLSEPIPVTAGQRLRITMGGGPRRASISKSPGACEVVISGFVAEPSRETIGFQPARTTT